jgi:hypothetical protein
MNVIFDIRGEKKFAKTIVIQSEGRNDREHRSYGR